PDRRVGRPGSARDQGDAWTARQLPVSLGHVGRAALVSTSQQPTAVDHVVETMKHGQVALARHAEDVVHAVADEALHQDPPPGAGQSRFAFPAHLEALAMLAIMPASNWLTASMRSLVTRSVSGTFRWMTPHLSRKSS